MEDLVLSQVFSIAWKNLKGTKKILWPFIATILSLIGLSIFISNTFLSANAWQQYLLNHLGIPAVLYLLSGPFYATLLNISAKHYLQPSLTTIQEGYRGLSHWKKAAANMLLIGLTANSLSLLLHIPTVSALFSNKILALLSFVSGLFALIVDALLVLTMPLLLSKSLSLCKAWRLSIQKIMPNLLKVFFLFLIGNLSLFLVYVPLMTGLLLHSLWITVLGGVLFIFSIIWLLPFLFMLGGALYHCLIQLPEIRQIQDKETVK